MQRCDVTSVSEASAGGVCLLLQVVLVPGCFFMPDDDAPCPYVRAAFSVASPQQMDVVSPPFRHATATAADLPHSMKNVHMDLRVHVVQS